MRKTLLNRYHEACKESNLADYERLQDNELLRAVREAVEAWTEEKWHGQEITLEQYEELLNLREKLLDTL